MKIDYNENRWELRITMIPETPKEVAQMLRAAKNAKAVKPKIYFSFNGDEPALNISLEKVIEQVQSNSINPSDRTSS